jgi:hypothetical protein
MRSVSCCPAPPRPAPPRPAPTLTRRRRRCLPQGRQGQLGLEGFFMGSMYMVFSLCVCGLIYGAPRVKNEGGRMVVSMATLAVSGLTLWQIITQWQAKTGFAPRSFFF